MLLSKMDKITFYPFVCNCLKTFSVGFLTDNQTTQLSNECEPAEIIRYIDTSEILLRGQIENLQKQVVYKTSLCLCIICMN